jgi:hypothetical protein
MGANQAQRAPNLGGGIIEQLNHCRGRLRQGPRRFNEGFEILKGVARDEVVIDAHFLAIRAGQIRCPHHRLSVGEHLRQAMQGLAHFRFTRHVGVKDESNFPLKAI